MAISPAVLEVERKFTYKSDVEDVLQALGATLQGQLLFRDTYYDTMDLRLTLCDHWLRNRQGSWEFKLPFSPHESGRSSNPVTQYQELTQKKEIIAAVGELLGCTPLSEGMEALVAELGLQAFASYVTDRRSYVVPREGLHVDLDEADFGFAVGEVEKVVATAEEVPEALERINHFCVQLGVTGVKKVPGKMTTYLRQYRPEHYQKLKEAHVL
ncbi:thiamine-triphosphatase [Microcaecilia unicolor]|uniref:Thiamine-triphosphatase n=1 Tax=Microcaecilia unicolor TaxID=1415580 RepID=A0A6P7YQS4_9AMPH|nr:thiamine-triphosphatase-like [Microcaecilia unicolor]XP_030065485.1 thiamine-triphosphatase-like [Microcaecilia unicolor]